MPHRRRGPPPGRRDRAVSGREQVPVALRNHRRRAPRLRPGPLLEKQELAARVVDTGAAQVDDHLKRKHQVPIEVSMQGVPIPLPIPQQNRRRPRLSGRVTHPQPLIERVRPWRGTAQPGRPGTGHLHQPGIQRLLQALDRGRVGRLEVAVFALPESVPSHVDGAPEQLVSRVQRAKAGGLLCAEEAWQDRAAVFIQLG